MDPQDPVAFMIICTSYVYLYLKRGPSWSLSYGSWIYNYLCNECLSPL